MLPGLLAAALACHAVDGDTIRCGKERVRLIGIDAADDPNSSRCRPYPKPGAICDKQKYEESKASMREILTGEVVLTETFGRDKFKRILAIVHANGVDVACEQLVRGQVVYKPEWDKRHRVKEACGVADSNGATR